MVDVCAWLAVTERAENAPSTQTCNPLIRPTREDRGQVCRKPHGFQTGYGPRRGKETYSRIRINGFAPGAFVVPQSRLTV